MEVDIFSPNQSHASFVNDDGYSNFLPLPLVPLIVGGGSVIGRSNQRKALGSAQENLSSANQQLQNAENALANARSEREKKNAERELAKQKKLQREAEEEVRKKSGCVQE